MYKEFTRLSETGRALRIQIVDTTLRGQSGYCITRAEEVGVGPDDLRHYGGGWRLHSHLFHATLERAQKSLERKGWRAC